MNNIVIERMSNLDKKYRKEVAQVFVDAYYDYLTFLSKDKHKLSEAFEHAFVSDVFFVALSQEKVVGILACSNNKNRALHIQKKELRKHFGFLKGTISHSFMKKNFHTPLNYSDDTTYIESVATSTQARGKGVATLLMDYVYNQLPYTDYILEVVDTNTNAIRLYEKLDYCEFERKKAKLPKLMGFEYAIYMKKCKSSTAMA